MDPTYIPDPEKPKPDAGAVDTRKVKRLAEIFLRFIYLALGFFLGRLWG